MRLVIAAIGKMRVGPEAALVEDYCKRAAGAGRSLGFSGPEIRECETPKTLTGYKRQAREGESLLKAVPEGARIFLLDERGENIPSDQFARMLADLRDDGVATSAFLIGGADGHGKEMKQRAAKILSFGAATWPHMLVRVMLAEQLYRAITILLGHPYHRS